MPNNFYQDPNTNQDPNQDLEHSKVKIGEKEYSQEDLQKLVGLGETAAGLETQWNTKIDKLMPEFTKKAQRLAELEPELETLKKEKEEAIKKVNSNPDLSPEQREQARKAILEILGEEVVKPADFDKYYVQRRSAEMLIEEAEATLNEAKSQGKPVATKEELIKYMQETGINNPGKAYKVMFETELDKWKEEQLKLAKPTGFKTQDISNAGSKQPAQVRPNKSNLSQLLDERLG